MKRKTISRLYMIYGAIAVIFGTVFLIVSRNDVAVSQNGSMVEFSHALTGLWRLHSPFMLIGGSIYIAASRTMMNNCKNGQRLGLIAAGLTIVWYTWYAWGAWGIVALMDDLPVSFMFFSVIGSGFIVCGYPLYVLVIGVKQSVMEDNKQAEPDGPA